MFNFHTLVFKSLQLFLFALSFLHASLCRNFFFSSTHHHHANIYITVNNKDSISTAKVDVQFYGTVVTPHDLVVHPRVLHYLPPFLIHQKVIQPPTDVLLSPLRPHAPPRVLHYLGVQPSERVNPTLLQKLRETVSLLNGEAGCLLVPLRPGNIDLLVAHVQVPTHDHRLLLSQLFTVFLEAFVIVAHSVLKPVQLLPGVRNVGRDQVELLELHRQHSSLLRVLTFGQVFLQGYRQVLREDGDSRVASRTLAEVPVAMVAFQLDLGLVEGFLVDLGFVDADDVGLRLVEVLLQVLPVEDGPDAIDVPGGEEELVGGFSGAVTPLALTRLGMLGFFAGKLFGLGFGDLRFFFFGHLGGEQFGLLFLGRRLLQRGGFLWRHPGDFNIISIIILQQCPLSSRVIPHFA